MLVPAGKTVFTDSAAMFSHSGFQKLAHRGNANHTNLLKAEMLLMLLIKEVSSFEL